MFDGSFKASRKVNLSGRKKPLAAMGSGGFGASPAPFSASNFASLSSFSTSSTATLSKEELMLQSKRAREARLEQKKQSTACTTIQTMVRRVSTGRKARRGMLHAVDRHLGELGARVDLRTHAVPTKELRLLLRQFLFGYGNNSNSRDSSSAAQVKNVLDHLVLMLLISCLKGDNVDNNFLHAPKDAAWFYQVRGRLVLLYLVVVC